MCSMCVLCSILQFTPKTKERLSRDAIGGGRFSFLVFFLARGGVGFFSPTSYSLSCVLWKPPLVLGCVNKHVIPYV